MTSKSLIKNREAAKQINDFSGLSWGKITPTDIDGFVEFGGKLFVCMECKYKNAEMGKGQKLALLRTSAAIHNPPKTYASLVLAKSEHPVEEDIDYANLDVAKVWFPGNIPVEITGDFKKDLQNLDAHWKNTNKNVKDLIDNMAKWVEC